MISACSFRELHDVCTCCCLAPRVWFPMLAGLILPEFLFKQAAQAPIPRLSCAAGVTAVLHGAGNFLAYCSKAPKAVRVGSQEASYNFEDDSGKLTVQVQATADLHNEVQITF